jgi:hypothetical protein
MVLRSDPACRIAVVVHIIVFVDGDTRQNPLRGVNACPLVIRPTQEPHTKNSFLVEFVMPPPNPPPPAAGGAAGRTMTVTHAVVDRIAHGDVSGLTIIADDPEVLATAAPMVRHQLYSTCLAIIADTRGMLSTGSGVKPESAKALRALTAILLSHSEAGAELRQSLRDSGADEVRRLKLHRHIISQKDDVRPAALEFAVYVTELLRVRPSDVIVDNTSASIASAIETERISLHRRRLEAARAGGGDDETSPRTRADSNPPAIRGVAGAGTQRPRSQSAAAVQRGRPSGPPGAPPPPPPTGAGGGASRITLPAKASTKLPATNPLFSDPSSIRREAPDDFTIEQETNETVAAAEETANATPPPPELESVMLPTAVSFFAKHFGFNCVPVLPDVSLLPDHHSFLLRALSTSGEQRQQQHPLPHGAPRHRSNSGVVPQTAPRTAGAGPLPGAMAMATTASSALAAATAPPPRAARQSPTPTPASSGCRTPTGPTAGDAAGSERCRACQYSRGCAAWRVAIQPAGGDVH